MFRLSKKNLVIDQLLLPLPPSELSEVGDLTRIAEKVHENESRIRMPNLNIDQNIAIIFFKGTKTIDIWYKKLQFFLTHAEKCS